MNNAQHASALIVCQVSECTLPNTNMIRIGYITDIIYHFYTEY